MLVATFPTFPRFLKFVRGKDYPTTSGRSTGRSTGFSSSSGGASSAMLAPLKPVKAFVRDTAGSVVPKRWSRTQSVLVERPVASEAWLNLSDSRGDSRSREGGHDIEKSGVVPPPEVRELRKLAQLSPSPGTPRMPGFVMEKDLESRVLVSPVSSHSLSSFPSAPSAQENKRYFVVRPGEERSGSLTSNSTGGWTLRPSLRNGSGSFGVESSRGRDWDVRKTVRMETRFEPMAGEGGHEGTLF